MGVIWQRSIAVQSRPAFSWVRPDASNARFYGRIRVWRIEDGKQLATFRGHKRRTTSIVFSPDSRFLASTGWDGKVRFWKMPPRNYSWLWLFCAAELAAIVYWQERSNNGLVNFL